MGAITRSIANNITTSGVFTSSAITNNSVTGITVLPNAEDGITLISSQTASNSASISFTSGLTSTYKAYKFVFSSIRARTNDAQFTFQSSTNGGSSYGVTTTDTMFRTYHFESDSGTGLAYEGAFDLAQSSSFITINYSLGNNADDNLSGNMQIFNPSSTTYVKHFISTTSSVYETSASGNLTTFIAGYFNTTSAINAVQFKMSTGNFDGTIYLYGIK
jgi:hypothetical protein